MPHSDPIEDTHLARAELTSNLGLLVLFDGQCMLCSGWVRFLRSRDAKGIMRFASLQSDQGQSILSEHGLRSDALDSMVTIAQDRAFIKSSAGLLCLRYLSFPWSLVGLLLWLVPPPLRDWVYDRVAKRRHLGSRHENSRSQRHAKTISIPEGQDHG